MNHFEIISTVAVLLLLAGAIVTLVFMAISDATRKPEPDWKAIADGLYREALRIADVTGAANRVEPLAAYEKAKHD